MGAFTSYVSRKNVTLVQFDMTACVQTRLFFQKYFERIRDFFYKNGRGLFVSFKKSRDGGSMFL